MQLVNQTPIPATVHTGHQANSPYRRGLVAAKATFRIDGPGRVSLDRDQPLAVVGSGEEHAGAPLPPDLTAIRRDPFEVMLIGSVTRNEAVTEARVSMGVGGEVRRLDVIGDRVWDGEAMSAPLPFRDMPLSWDRAFGGTAVVDIDDGAKVKLFHADNPSGRGFDPGPQARALCEQLRAPAGYPQLPVRPRQLPNLEDPDHRIIAPADTPKPLCWAPMPEDCMLRAEPMLAHLDDPVARDREGTKAALRDAHPCWWISRPERGARLSLSGLWDDDVAVPLPALRVLVDYVAGERRGARELIPQALVVFADERRFTISYRFSFLVEYEPGIERSMRLRTEEGWYDGGDHG